MRMTLVKHRFRLQMLLAAACVCSAAAANGQSIFSNPITDANPSTANPFTAGQTFDPNITVSGVGRGPGVNANAGSNRYNASAWSFPSFDANDYFTFTLTPNTGYAIDFTNLAGMWQRSSTGPNSYALRSSLDNFAADLATGAITGSGSAVSYDLSLASSSLDAVTSAIEFRLYGWAGTGASGTFSFNDFTFNGTVNPVVSATPTTYSLAASITGPSTVIVGGSTAVSSKITNTGVAPNDALNFTGLSANATGGTIGGPGSNGNAVALGANATNSGLSFTGTTPGAATVTPSVATATNATIPGNATESSPATTTSVTVLDHADGAFNALGSNTISHNFGSVAQGSSPADFAFDIHNLITSAGFTSELDLAVTGIQGTGDTSVFTTNVGAIADLAAGNFQSFLASFNTTNPGTFSATYTFNVGDNTAYNGAVANGTPLVLELSGSVTGTVLHAGDFDGDGDVDGADFVAWQTNFPKESGAILAQGDADADGDVDGADFVVWQTNFPFPSGSGTSPVPEPGSLLIAALGVAFGTLALRRRNRA
jgi:hypothetical protein